MSRLAQNAHNAQNVPHRLNCAHSAHCALQVGPHAVAPQTCAISALSAISHPVRRVFAPQDLRVMRVKRVKSPHRAGV